MLPFLMIDHVAFYYDVLPKGTYDFYFRTRATVPGSFIQPAAHAEMMYDGAVRGNSNGALIRIQKVSRSAGFSLHYGPQAFACLSGLKSAIHNAD